MFLAKYTARSLLSLPCCLAALELKNTKAKIIPLPKRLRVYGITFGSLRSPLPEAPQPLTDMARTTTSPLSILLCAIFLFSANVLAVSAVLGVDLGTEYIKAALVKPGIPLEIVLTKDSRRKETSAVAFKPAPNGPQAGSYP